MTYAVVAMTTEEAKRLVNGFIAKDARVINPF